MDKSADPHADAKAILAAYFESLSGDGPAVQPSNVGWPKVAAYVRDLENQNRELAEAAEAGNRWRVILSAMAVFVNAAAGLKGMADRIAKLDAEMKASKEKGGNP